MRERRTHPGDAAAALAALGTAAAAVAIGVAGPTGALPVHFGWDGVADGFGTRVEVALLMGVFALLTATLGLGMGMAARRAPDAARTRALRAGQLMVVVVITCVAVLLGSVSVTGVVSMADKAPTAGLCLLLLLTGAVLGRVGPNPVAGVRTPWALKSRTAWDRSNRLAGRLFSLIGLAGLIAAPVAPQPLAFQAVIVGTLIAAAASVFESWRVWRTDPERQPF